MPSIRRSARESSRRENAQKVPGSVAAARSAILSRNDGATAMRRHLSHRRVAVGPSTKICGSSLSLRWV